MPSTLRSLANLITSSVDTLERIYAGANLPLPDLDAPFDADAPAEALRAKPEVAAAIRTLQAAAGQISVTVADPPRHAAETSFIVFLPFALQAASILNVADIIRESGSKGATSQEISAWNNNADPELITRILRTLATHHIFREVSPSVFTNNRISSTLDKNKPVKELYANPAERLVGSSGVAARIEHIAGIGGKSGTELVNNLLQPGSRLPFGHAYDTDLTLFEWMYQNRDIATRFGYAMMGKEPLELVLEGFKWKSLKEGDTVVDVGGGLGHLGLIIAKHNPKVRIITQDFSMQVERAKAYWETNFPEHVQNGKVEWQVHNFFTPEPVKNATVFLMRNIIHDWDDPHAHTILRHLRDAAMPTTKLVILEKILVPVGGGEPDIGVTISGARKPEGTSPLLPNWGLASAPVYTSDLAMHILTGGIERTLTALRDLFAKAGWKLVEVIHSDQSEISHLISEAA
ncbi:O-methyltransferase [Mycena alexandri]|uniref:O-methyltransferase n=1 Tax=Mycena alexandri TaxID=1745969 RepID=A0AAD6S380_9AGAR|nr:O-methyltransferase [Mycena alexandri]